VGELAKVSGNWGKCPSSSKLRTTATYGGYAAQQPKLDVALLREMGSPIDFVAIS
jgi:hypothetical protein